MLMERTKLLRWLLARVRPREFDSNKQYAAEVLAILVQVRGEGVRIVCVQPVCGGVGECVCVGGMCVGVWIICVQPVCRVVGECVCVVCVWGYG